MIAGRYDELENGLARDVELDRVVRLRWIASADEVDDPRLSHPNVVRVFDLGEHEGRRFAAVEHVQGLPLALVAPLSAEEAIRLGVQACRGLAAAHDLGLVHMGEIIVRQDGVPKLAGFRRGEPGPDVRDLAESLNDVSPELPALRSTTTTELARELERARPASVAATAPTTAVAPGQQQRRRVSPVAVIAAVALIAVIIGVVALLTGGGDSQPQRTQVARVAPVPHAARAEQQARNLARWLSRYSR
jgi:hypothetical protein